MMDTDEPAVHKLLAAVLDAWARGDGHAFAEQFTPDGDVIAFDGSHLHGRAQIAATMQQMFDTLLKGTRCVAEVKSLRFLSSDVVLMHTSGGVVLPGEIVVPPERNSIQTFVAVKSADVWSVAAFQNTRIQPIGSRPPR